MHCFFLSVSTRLGSNRHTIHLQLHGKCVEHVGGEALVETGESMFIEDMFDNLARRHRCGLGQPRRSTIAFDRRLC
jgi:hypothetical protein